MHIAANVLKVLLVLALMWISLFLTTLFHEFGHVLMYQILFRDKKWRIHTGTGKIIAETKRFTLRALPLFGSYSCASKHEGGSKFKHIMVYLGGPLANLLIIAFLAIILRVNKADQTLAEQPGLVWILSFAFWANVYQFVSAIIPMNYASSSYMNAISDGKRIVRKLKEKGLD